MSHEQRFEYNVVNIPPLEITKGDGEEQINELASEGWRLVEAYNWEGDSKHLIFERPVE